MPRLSIHLFGPLQITLDGQPVTGFKYDKVRALLAYLAVEADRPHRRDALIGLLWPDLPESAARTNLRQALVTLRNAIDDRTADPPFLLISRSTLQLNPAGDCWSDVAEFTSLMAACDQHAHRRLETCNACAERLHQVVDLYRGDFLAGFSLPDAGAFEEWALLEREWLSRRMMDALASLAAYHEQRGDYVAACRYVRRQLELDPWREEAHRQVMRLLMLCGERSAALVQYETCHRILAEELDVEPDAETTALYEQIRDAADDDLPREIKHLNGPLASPRPLPPPATPFVGREKELAQIADLLDNGDCRLLVLTGAGGIGKTRLAFQTAMDHRHEFGDGVCFVPLVSLEDPSQLPTAIADALKLTLQGQQDAGAQLVEALRIREILLVLDNFEHLLSGGEFLVELLANAPDVTLLVTSRERLNLHGEWVYAVPGLAAPEEEDSGEEIERFSAVELFIRCARRAHTGFELSAENAQAVAHICRMVQGIPLAIELAAAWTRMLSCEDVAREIEQGIDFLTTPVRDLPERHRSLRAVFDHSWRLLSPREQRIFQQLSVFRGGFERKGAEQVAGAALTDLAALVDKSMLRWNLAGRYEMHELLRQYATAKLLAFDELGGRAEDVRARHLAFYLDLAESAEPHLSGEEQVAWLSRLERERDNLSAVLDWCLEKGRRHDGLRLATALYYFWYLRSHLAEGRYWLETFLDPVDEATQRADPADTDSPEVADRRSEIAMRARAYRAVGVLADEQGDHVVAERLTQEALALYRTLDDRRGLASALNTSGILAWGQKDYDRAAALLEESLALRRALGDEEALAMPFNNLGLVALAQGNPSQAKTYFEECLHRSRRAGSTLGIAVGLSNLGVAMLDLDDAAGARSLFAESLPFYQDVGDQDGVASCLEGLAAADAALGEAGQAARLCAAAQSLRASIGAPLSPTEKIRYERTVAAIREQLGEDEFARAWTEGVSMSVERAIGDGVD